MLKLDSETFTTGQVKYLDRSAGHGEATAKIFVRIIFSDLETLAQIDTGAAFSVLDAELAEQLGLLGGEGELIPLSTRQGTIFGRLERVAATLVADKGEDLDIEATVFISKDWRGKTFLGYSGLLDHLRIAIDPSLNDFYFGAVDFS